MRTCYVDRMNWTIIGIEFAIVLLATPAVVAVLGNALNMNAPTVKGLIVRSLCTAIVFAGGLALWAMIPFTIPYLGMVVPFGLLMLAGFMCWGFEFPEDTTYASCFALVIWVVRFAAHLTISGFAGE